MVYAANALDSRQRVDQVPLGSSPTQSFRRNWFVWSQLGTYWYTYTSASAFRMRDLSELNKCKRSDSDWLGESVPYRLSTSFSREFPWQWSSCFLTFVWNTPFNK